MHEHNQGIEDETEIREDIRKIESSIERMRTIELKLSSHKKVLDDK